MSSSQERPVPAGRREEHRAASGKLSYGTKKPARLRRRAGQGPVCVCGQLRPALAAHRAPGRYGPWRVPPAGSVIPAGGTGQWVGGQAVALWVWTVLVNTSFSAGTRRSWTMPRMDRTSRIAAPANEVIAANRAIWPNIQNP